MTKRTALARDHRFVPRSGSRSVKLWLQGIIVTMEPMTNSFPHSHSPHWEEVWLKLPPDDSIALLGSEVRRQHPNEAFLVPPDGKTWHAVVNLTDKPMYWLYIGHYTEPVDYPDWVYKVPAVRSH